MLKITKKTMLSIIALGSLATATKSKAEINVADFAIPAATSAVLYYTFAMHKPSLHSSNPVNRILDTVQSTKENVVKYCEAHYTDALIAAAAGLLVYNKGKINSLAPIINDFVSTNIFGRVIVVK